MEKQQLAPDPGPQRRKSKPVSPLGFLHAVLVVFGASGVLLVMWIAGKIGLQFVDKFKPPHLALYQNETWDQVTNRSTVVRPLVSADDRFDIIATVWLRGNASQQAAYQADRYPDTASELVEDSKDTHFHREIRMTNMGQLSVWSDEGVRPTKAQDDIFEVALYSGVIFQNATLSDKGLTAEVPFLEQNLTAEHLRASFIVSPSVKMDHLRNFSSWMPDYVLETRWRSRAASPTEQKSLIDRAIDSFSLSVPMIAFHPIMSHCDVILNAAGFTNTTPAHNQLWGSNASRHPHVTSRLHLRILNEQHLFNLQAYNTVHDKLRRTSCGLGYNLGKSPGLPHRSVCLRTYEDVGPMETRLEFSDSHHGETEWAYAPFLSAALNAAGPLDHIPVPVNRVNCSAQVSYNSTSLPVLEPSLLNDTMKVIWHVSFSGRTPRKMLLSDLTAFAPVINASQSELERIEEQVWFEYQNTLRGHRFNVDSHPRRRLVAYTLGSLSGLFAVLLDILYYRRLRLTVGISIRGQWLSTAGFLAWAVKPVFNSSDFVEKIVLGCFYIFLSSMLILAMGLFLADPYQRNLIPSPLPPDPEVTVRSTAGNIFSASVTTAHCMSDVLQLLMNHRARTFGGMYKASVWLMLAERVLHFVLYLPAILGHIPDRAPLSLGTVINVLPLLVRAWQAWTLPAAKTEEEEESES
ncbi:hypothetical protein B0H17DRAFT_1135523 [Mycena rosella]|uniref:Uncharacterized protein n=1 Tax=Mycena rosella TaxID=1033263 RepID=A0AAD7GHQ3_MYCRO|nr:hypothetical protein B0H17DRAFT_1135523 [Mycena rosella]